LVKFVSYVLLVSTLGLPTFFYSAVYRVVENETKAFTTTQKANNAEFTKFHKHQSILAMF